MYPKGESYVPWPNRSFFCTIRILSKSDEGGFIMNRMNDLNCLLAEKLVEDIKKDHEASGIAVAIIDKSGKTQYEKFWGVRDLESGKEVNGDTIFGLASVTKSFTALSIMQLEEKGMIDLDAPISQYIPEFTNKNQSKKVTVRHLLSHAGGFFPLPRILVGNVAESLGLDEEKDGDFAYNDAVAQEGVQSVWMHRRRRMA
jgi:CubicO group peptidase (beta-lactamase class C family)